MKKSIIALAVSSLALASVAQAAPQEDTFYVGAKAGWAQFHDGLGQFDQAPYGVYKNSVTYGIFGGYQLFNDGNFGLAAELGYDDFGTAKRRYTENGKTTNDAKMTNHGASVSLKGSYQIAEGFDVFGRLGAALVRSDYKFKKPVKDAATEKYMHTLHVSPLFAAGFEYAILPELSASVEYQWINNVGHYKKPGTDVNTDFRPDISSVNFGLTYRFGQNVAPQIVTKNFTFSSDVLFGFDKAGLGQKVEALDNAMTEIANAGLENAAIEVKGYTDRIGSDKYNLKLSQKRAETVANYLVSKGVNSANLNAVGYGESNPVTGNTCDTVKGRKALVACLAPDRRVELQVQGVKKVTM